MYLFVSIRYRSINQPTSQPTNPDQRTHQPSPAPQHPHTAFVEVLLPACTHITHLSVVRSNCKLTLSRYEYLLSLGDRTGQAALCALPHRYGHGGAARQSQTVLWDWTKASSVYLCKDTTSREKPTKSSSASSSPPPPPLAIRPPRSVGPLQSPLCSGTCVRPLRLATRLRKGW